MRSVESEPREAPDLPDFMPDGSEWPDHTIDWWDAWVDDPLTNDYRMSDWLDLIDCAAIHGRMWQGDYKAAAELRLRMARHGATREDRARLRIVFATADETERKAKAGAAGLGKNATTDDSARARRGALKVAK
ncbi:terminase small subunit [Gordonia phage SweatNTears]|nr:terminase small subunit [Gordonia phage SweatNTears]